MTTPATAAMPPLTQVFAVCTGRLSAELEHSWLMQDGRGDHLQTQRDAMADLLLAVTPPAEAAQSLNLRINAKMAHWALLTQATFEQSEGQAQNARTLAKTHLALCTAYLLS